MPIHVRIFLYLFYIVLIYVQIIRKGLNKMDLIYKERKIRVKLNELYDKYDINQAELARLTSIDHARLSELENLKKKSVYIPHLLKIAEALDLESISEIIDFELIDEE